MTASLASLSPDEAAALWAALCAMVKDIHAPQDQLTPDQWDAAERLLAELDKRVNAEAT